MTTCPLLTILQLDALPLPAKAVTLPMRDFDVAKSMAAESKLVGGAGYCAVEEWVAVSRPGTRYENF